MFLLNLINIWFLALLGIYAINQVLYPNNQNNNETLNPFECGFDPEHKTQNAFSLRFFYLTVIFLIFDIEIAIILPIPLSPFSQSYLWLLHLNILFFIMLAGGLVYEWSQSSLIWTWNDI